MKKLKNYFWLWVILLLIGALTPSHAICQTKASLKDKVVALTFDDGPYKKSTEKILKILQENGAKATFFEMGGNVKLEPEILKKTFAAGHEIGNHTYSHPFITKISSQKFKNELLKTDAIIYNTIQVHPILFRPPFGMSSPTTNRIVNELGFKKITWDYMADDYQATKFSPETFTAEIIKHVKPGSIIVMHESGGYHQITLKSLPAILADLKQRGYKFVTVSELLNINPYRNKIAQ